MEAPAQQDVWNAVRVPDLWQQQAVAALREGKDVVVQAPTGSGKTLIFELWSNYGKNRGQAIYTVPTRALANDKLAEWRARGWDVGITTGDLSDNVNASIIVATLETQKNRLIQGKGPALLVVDEYQMLGDADRGLNYELALALAPPHTQLLLLSGSVANPQDVVKWFDRLGRKAVLIRHEHRPVPLEEVEAGHLSFHVPSDIRGYWPRFAAKALAENLGPILIFAPRRQGAEALAAEINRYLPTPNPLNLTTEQKQIAGEHLARMLKNRISYHHSGLSYAARAGVVEPLAKAGQLRVVVATMGLAAGINFSLRSVALAGDSYRKDYIEQPLKPDEILQMFGRAGRRGIDETGYVLVSANQIRLRDGHASQLSRSGLIDWSALLGVMSVAADEGLDPFAEAVRVQKRLFTTRPVTLGVEESLKHPVVPCGLKTDTERSRHVRKRFKEIRNSRGEWEPSPTPVEKALGEIQIVSFPEGEEPALRPVLSEPAALDKIGTGTLSVVEHKDGIAIYGRSMTLAEHLNDEKVLLTKWIRKLIHWGNRQAPLPLWKERILPQIEEKMAVMRTPVVKVASKQHRIVAYTSLAQLTMRVPVDRYGVALWNPVEKEVLPPDCAQCSLVPVCRQLHPAPGAALQWRRLGLVDPAGVPTRRGRLVSAFSQSDGLAISAALEDETYPLDELMYDLANLDAGFRFCGEEHRWGGRLAIACQKTYGNVSIPGYLESGIPPGYGAGAEIVVAAIHRNPLSKHSWVTEFLGAGDIDRVIIEWRSLLRQVSHGPALDWARWTRFKEMAHRILNETESPTLTELPPLEYAQTKRIEHKLVLRRH